MFRNWDAVAKGQKLPWCMRSIRQLAEYQYSTADKQHPVQRYPRSECMSTLECNENQYADLMSECCVDAMERLIKESNTLKWPKSDLEEHLFVFLLNSIFF